MLEQAIHASDSLTQLFLSLTGTANPHFIPGMNVLHEKKKREKRLSLNLAPSSVIRL